MCRRNHLYHSLLCVISLISVAGQAEVTFDNSLGQPITADTLSGEIIIPEGRGTLVGSNLFHSFQDFNINTGESATFTGQSLVENILGRVTGDNDSLIDGLLRTRFDNSDPNLFLMNPNGILFGPNASLDVEGSFHVTTADYLRLGDDGFFHADLNKKTTLSVAPIEAFGFLDDNPASIITSNSLLTGTPVTILSMIGGDISIIDSALFAPGGLIRIFSVGSAGVVDFMADNLGLDSFNSMGDIQIDHDPTAARIPIDETQVVGDIDVSASRILGIPGAGSVVIRGRDLAMKNSVIAAQTADVDGGLIDIGLTNELSIEGNLLFTLNPFLPESGVIRTGTLGDGNAGKINLSVGMLTMLDGALISSDSAPITQGNSGNIVVNVDRDIQITDGSQISSTTGGLGNGGNVSVAANNITISSGGEALSFLPNGELALGFFSGLYANAQGLDDSTQIAQENLSGTAGNILVNARDTLSINDGGVISSITLGSGGSGNIVVQADKIEIDSGGLISNNTSGTGHAGFLNISADKSIKISGVLDDIKFFGFSPRVSNKSGISSSSKDIFNTGKSQLGNAGIITLSAPHLTITNNAEIRTDSLGAGDTGAIFIGTTPSQDQNGNFTSLIGNQSAQTVSLDNAVITAEASGTGSGGFVFVNAEKITLSNEAEISTETTIPEGAIGRAGAISGVFIGTSLTIEKGLFNNGIVQDLILDNAVISAETSRSTEAGFVSVNANMIDLRNNASVTTSTFGKALGGVILIGADSSPSAGITSNHSVKNINLVDSKIVATTLAEGQGGRVEIQSDDIVIDNAIISASSESKSSNAGQSGDIFITTIDSLRFANGGNITVETMQADAGNINLNMGGFLQLNDNSAITTSAAVVNNQGTGNGGNITIKSDGVKPAFVILDNGSQIKAQAKEGDGGNIEISVSSLFKSPNSIIDASSQFGQSGTVTIDSPDTNVIEGALILPGSFLDASALLSQRCAARGGKRTSSFIVKPLEGFQPAPDDYLSGFYTNTAATAADTSQQKPVNNAFPLDIAVSDRSILCL